MHLYELASEIDVDDEVADGHTGEDGKGRKGETKDDWEIGRRSCRIEERAEELKRSKDDGEITRRRADKNGRDIQVLTYLLDFSKQLLDMYKIRGQLSNFKEVVYNLAVLYYCLPQAHKHKPIVFYHQNMWTIPQSDMLDCFFLLEYFRQSRYSNESLTMVYIISSSISDGYF